MLKPVTVATLAVTLATPVAGQDLTIELVTIGGGFGHYGLLATYTGSLPDASTSIGAIWADTSFVIRGNGRISIEAFNPAYAASIFGPPRITGNDTNEVSFEGVQAGPPIGTLDPSNPLLVACFTYLGGLNAFEFEMTGQNSALFLGDPNRPFGQIELYQDVNGNPGTLSHEFILLPFPPVVPDDACLFPAPGTLAFAPAALIAARRRRK